MIEGKADWTYANLPKERVDLLKSCPPFSQLVAKIADRINVSACEEFRIDKGRVIPVAGCFRPEFILTFDEPLADWFHNGNAGYRAQYFLSADNGRAANVFLMRAICNKLVQIAELHEFQFEHEDYGFLSMNAVQLENSLSFKSAKAWASEGDPEFKILVNSIPDFLPQVSAKRWIDSAESDCDKVRNRALRGLRAPIVKCISFKGAFVRNGEERIPPDKVNRDQELYECGFTGN